MGVLWFIHLNTMKFHIFLLIITYSVMGSVIEKTIDNYGPYVVEWQENYPCRGPKLANLTTFTSTLVKEADSFKGVINMTFLEQTKIEEVKMSVYTMKGDQKILLWNYIVNRPCQHYAMSKVFETKVGAQNCVVKKGTYMSDLNFTEVTGSYLGTSFFYGKFIFKVLVLSKKGNILCIVFNPIFKKKT